MANRRLALIATYYMARFNSKLGFGTDAQVFTHLSELTEVSEATLRIKFRDVFDHYFPGRKGWNLLQPDKQHLWTQELASVWEIGNIMSQTELKNLLQSFEVFAQPQTISLSRKTVTYKDQSEAV